MRVQNEAREIAAERDGHSSRLLLAGSYWLLLDADRAAVCFERASVVLADSLHQQTAEHRQLLSEAISPDLSRIAAATIVLCVLAGTPPSPVALKLVNASVAANPFPDLLAVLSLVTALENARGLDPTNDSAHLTELFVRYRATPIGRLGVPLRLYQQLAEALSLPRTEMIRATGSWFNTIGRRISDAVGAAQVDRYHWRMLYSTLLPFEPEVLSLFVTYEIRRQRLRELPVRRRYRDLSRHPAVAYEQAARVLVLRHGLDAPPLPQ